MTGGPRFAWILAAAMLALAVAAGCVDRLPAEDLRILSSTPVAKMSADVLWAEFQADAAAARGRYFGKAIEVTGVVTHATTDGGEEAYVTFGQQGDFGVRGNLLKDRASEALGAAKVGERFTLRCFCEGLDGHVVLRSCIRP